MQRFYATVEKVYARFFMAKPYLLYKTSNNIYYAEILLPDGSHANKKSTGCKNRADELFPTVKRNDEIARFVPHLQSNRLLSKTRGYMCACGFSNRHCISLCVQTCNFVHSACGRGIQFRLAYEFASR